MKKQEVIREYHFQDGELITEGKAKIAFMRRDATEFATYGIEGTAIDSLEAAIETFTDNVTDVELLGKQILSTEAKDGKAEAVREGIRAVMDRVVLEHESNSTEYELFGTASLSRQTDSELMITAKRVYRLGTEGLAVFAQHGVTAAMLSSLLTAREELDDLMVDQKIKIGLRDNLQEDRVEEGNAIYKKLVAYTGTGKSIWEASDVAKYNDYVLYEGEKGGTPAEPTL